MATSGSVDYSISRAVIIKEAAETAGILAIGQTLSSEANVKCIRLLNMLVKQWQGTSDFATGLKEWKKKRATIFLQKDQDSYSLGPSGDHATASYTNTTLSVQGAASATTLTVASITGISSGDNIGIELDDGSVHWTTVNGAPTGSTVVITTGLASIASATNQVYAYTTKMQRPLKLITALLRNKNNEDAALKFMSLGDYEAISNKTEDGTPGAVYYEPQLTNGVLYLDREPDDVSKHIHIVFYGAAEDFDADADEPDYPQEWYRALVYGLALEISVAFRRPIDEGLAALASQSLAIAQNANPEICELFFQPGSE